MSITDSVWGAEDGAGGEQSDGNERFGGPGRDWGRRSAEVLVSGFISYNHSGWPHPSHAGSL